MQKFYADAFFARPPVVLGQQLEPLSLGHALVLHTLCSPCVLQPMDRPVLTFDEAILGVWVCSRPWEAARAGILDGTWKTDMRTWGQRTGSSKGILARWAADLKLFEEYLQVYVQMPPALEEVWKDGKKVSGRPCKVPWPLSVAWRLMERMDKVDVLSLPLPEAFAWHACARDANDDESLLSEQDEERLKRSAKNVEKRELATDPHGPTQT